MTTPRVTIEELTLDRALTADFELLAHRTSDQREVRITLASALALVSVMTGGIGWTISANAPANPTLGQGWFDSSNESVSHLDGRTMGIDWPDTDRWFQ